MAGTRRALYEFKASLGCPKKGKSEEEKKNKKETSN